MRRRLRTAAALLDNLSIHGESYDASWAVRRPHRLTDPTRGLMRDTSRIVGEKWVIGKGVAKPDRRRSVSGIPVFRDQGGAFQNDGAIPVRNAIEAYSGRCTKTGGRGKAVFLNADTKPLLGTIDNPELYMASSRLRRRPAHIDVRIDVANGLRRAECVCLAVVIHRAGGFALLHRCQCAHLCRSVNRDIEAFAESKNGGHELGQATVASPEHSQRHAQT